MKDYYKILEIDESSTSDDIKKAYRSLALKYHPDKNPNDKEAESKFKEIADAYDTLGNKTKKKKYDSLRNPRVYHNVNDMFNGFSQEANYASMFNQAYGRGNNGKGKNTYTDISITMEDAYHGCEREIVIGYNKNVKLTIKKGVRNGMKLRLKGLGQRGVTEELNGDLIVNIKIIDHSKFFIDNKGLHVIEHIDAITAMIGGKGKLTIFDKDITYTIPQGTQNGKILRIKGNGFPVYENSGNYSDILVNVFIQIPKNLSDEDIQLLKKIKNKQYE